jgi:hypothetical protein
MAVICAALYFIALNILPGGKKVMKDLWSYLKIINIERKRQ